MQRASVLYSQENDGHVIQAGLAHVGGRRAPPPSPGSTPSNPTTPTKLLARCPSDFPPPTGTSRLGGGIPVPGINPPTYRLTSYGINDLVDPDLYVSPFYPPGAQPFARYNNIPNPSATIQFVEMVRTGGFAAADHPHVENWPANPPTIAASQLETDAHGTPAAAKNSRANYGFLDGHAETVRFSDTYTSPNKNNYDPAIAK